MQFFKIGIIMLVLSILVVSPSLTLAEECAVDCDKIISGGPAPDGIPPLENPVFETVEEADRILNYDDIVIGVIFKGEARAYPYEILDWHEIVNDVFDGEHISITYCPLTGSGILYRVENIGSNNTFGTSGKLYENNLVMYDRNTGSYYSQMLGKGITGDNINVPLESYDTVEMTWDTWKLMYPDSKILSRDTGYDRNYARYPYGTYKTDDGIRFPSTYREYKDIANIYQTKTLTVVLELSGITNLISFNELSIKPAFSVDDAVIFFDENAKFANVFSSKLDDGTELKFESAKSELESSFNLQVFSDQDGNIWNMKGVAIEGDRIGNKLDKIKSYNAYWFSTVALFPDANIHFAGDTPNTIVIETSNTESAPIVFPILSLFIPIILIKKRR